MAYGTISIDKTGDGRWRVGVKNDIDSAAGFGDTVAEAFKNLAGCLDGGSMGARLLAWEAYNAGWDSEPAASESRSQQFETWWGKR